MTPRAHERLRARLWVKSYVAMVRQGVTYAADAREVADEAVKAFDERFTATVPTISAARMDGVIV